tara:strand:+ start:1000 stop:1203 length:204 start_codon:yes stop_codon:yes gene_type:complete
MPIWLRKFTVKEIQEQNKRESKQIKDAQKSENNSSSTNIGDPLPDHMKQVFKQAEKKSSYITQRAKK